VTAAQPEVGGLVEKSECENLTDAKIHMHSYGLGEKFAWMKAISYVLKNEK